MWAVCMSRHGRAAASPLACLQWDVVLYILNKVCVCVCVCVCARARALACCRR